MNYAPTGMSRSVANLIHGARRNARAAAALLLVTLAVAGCSSSGKQTQGDPTYIQDYQSKRYTQAYDGSKAAVPNLRGAAKEQALLIQGESAHAINRNSEAKLLLRPLADTSQDPRTSGQAAATLGLIYQEEGDFDDGAKYLSLASDKLDGDASARSALYAGDCLKSLGRTDEARSMYEKAQQSVRTDNSLRGMIADRLKPSSASPGVGKFTLQAGAFSTQQRAQAQADRLRQSASNAGLGSPRVVQTSSKGKTLYTVRVGRFTSRDDAVKAAKTMGVEAMVATGE